MGNTSKALKEFWKRLFRPPCFGDGVHCPVLFSQKQYDCKYYSECEAETLKKFKETLRL